MQSSLWTDPHISHTSDHKLGGGPRLLHQNSQSWVVPVAQTVTTSTLATSLSAVKVTALNLYCCPERHSYWKLIRKTYTVCKTFFFFFINSKSVWIHTDFSKRVWNSWQLIKFLLRFRHEWKKKKKRSFAHVVSYLKTTFLDGNIDTKNNAISRAPRPVLLSSAWD